ncbi:hypothetical protein ACH495_30575 [Micromonospora sp. NPDC018662]|uniref:hypothetical protein n=1 Tax=Micromonospora sp. NPDC018662 TaxID=3364238 RepID=UPI00379AC4A7
MLTTAQVLAENNFGDTRTGGLAGPMGLFLIIALATVTVLLIRNMNARLRRLPDRFPAQAEPGRVDAAVVDPTDGVVEQDSPTNTPNGPQQRRNS